MVDFDNEITISKPAIDIERVSVLQRRQQFIDAYEIYQQDLASNIDRGSKGKVVARLISLFLQTEPMVKRNLDQKDYENMKKLVEKKSMSDKEIAETYEKINTVLDKIHLTKLDIHKKIDRARVVQTNEGKEE